MERCFTAAVIREMQMKIARRSQGVPTSPGQDVEKLSDIIGGHEAGAAAWKDGLAVFRKSVILEDPAILLLRVFPRDMKTCVNGKMHV